MKSDTDFNCQHMIGRCTLISMFKSIPINKLRSSKAREYTGNPNLKTKQKQNLRFTILLHIAPSNSAFFFQVISLLFLIPTYPNIPCTDITSMYCKGTALHIVSLLDSILSLVLLQLHFFPFYLLSLPIFSLFFLTSFFSLLTLTISFSLTPFFFQTIITQAVKTYTLISIFLIWVYMTMKQKELLPNLPLWKCLTSLVYNP